GGPGGAVAVVPVNAFVARGPAAGGREMTDMLWETMETPDGPFTVLADDEGTVLSAGWSSDPETVIARVRPADRPARAHAGVTGVAAVVSAYYDGDLAA